MQNIDEIRKKKKKPLGGLPYFPNPGSPEGMARFNGECPNCKPKADEPVSEAEPVADPAGEAVGVEGGAAGGEAGAAVGESFELDEAKRYVRRYYIRPQNIFCSNKAEILKALIDIGDQNCSIYTLNNLTDNNQVAKLTNADIIYYYDEGILYDKNHVKVMDYDLYVKHEEERKKLGDLNDKVAGNASAEAVYDDRITDATEIEEAFNLNFDSINAYGENLTEAKRMEDCCCICGEPLNGYGNNPAPYKKEGRCCDACNTKFVIPARIENMRELENPQGEDDDKDTTEIDESLTEGYASPLQAIDYRNMIPSQEDFSFIASAKKVIKPLEDAAEAAEKKAGSSRYNRVETPESLAIKPQYNTTSYGICLNAVKSGDRRGLIALIKLLIIGNLLDWPKLTERAQQYLTKGSAKVPGYNIDKTAIQALFTQLESAAKAIKVDLWDVMSQYAANADESQIDETTKNARGAFKVTTKSDLYKGL